MVCVVYKSVIKKRFSRSLELVEMRICVNDLCLRGCVLLGFCCGRFLLLLIFLLLISVDLGVLLLGLVDGLVGGGFLTFGLVVASFSIQLTVGLEVLVGQLLLEGHDVGVEVGGLVFLELCFPDDDLRNALNEAVDQIDFRKAETIGVGDVPLAFGVGGGVDTGGAAGLELHRSQNLLEIVAGGELGNFNDGAGAETCAQIGGAGQDESQMVVVHEVLVHALQDILDGLGGVGEASEDSMDVVTLLHGDDAHLILFVDPGEEVLGLVGEDTTGVGPMAAAAGGQQQGGVGLLEQIAVVAELLLFLEGHTVGVLTGGVGFVAVEGEVLTLELTFQFDKSVHNHLLDLASFLEGGGRGQASATDGAASAAASGGNVLAGGINLGG